MDSVPVRRTAPSAVGRRAALLAVLGLAAACGTEPTEPVTRSQFIEVMAALRAVDMATDGTAEFNARRDSILGAAALTDSALVDFARRHGDDVTYMAEVWDSIARRLAGADTIMR